MPSTKRTIVLLIQAGIASFHVFRLGRLLGGEWYRLYYSYFSDVALPFGVFLLTLSEERVPLLRPWYGKAGTVLTLTTAAEVAQYFGLHVLAVIFDPLDIVMYGVGVLLATLLDVKVLAPNVRGWAILGARRRCPGANRRIAGVRYAPISFRAVRLAAR